MPPHALSCFSPCGGVIRHSKSAPIQLEGLSFDPARWVKSMGEKKRLYQVKGVFLYTKTSTPASQAAPLLDNLLARPNFCREAAKLFRWRAGDSP
jgi:hypothetical protein